MSSSRNFITTEWQLARLKSAEQTPSNTEWFEATVPGGVQLDWARAHKLPDYNYGQNVRAYYGLEDSFWLYRTTVPATQRTAGECLFFTCAGLDYSATIRLAGRVIHTHTGLITPFEIDLSDAAAGSVLEILIHPAPKRHAEPADRSQASHVTKPAVSYGWDWHPRLITLGLCSKTGFEVRPALHLRHVDFAYTLADDFSSAAIKISVETNRAAAAFSWQLHAPDGTLVLEGKTATATLAAPKLWWTHDHGTPALYSLTVTLSENGDTIKRRVGFRRIRLVMAPGQWDFPSTFPKPRSHSPVTFELNGRSIFAKGSNWVNPDIFHGRITAETYRPLLQLAKEANMNILRCWGGAPAAHESFFEQCDELGILIWQEFPLACNLYPDDATYLALLDQESRALIRRLRQHPSVALWVGGNELFNVWSGMTDQSHPLRLLNKNCYELDPQTPFLATAPIDGMAHGDYRFRDDRGRDIFQIFQSAAHTAYSEFGCPGPSPVEYLKTFIPEAELFPPRPGSSWETHHALGSWDVDPTTWLCTSTIEHYFGSSPDLATLVARGEWLQCSGYQSVFEEARRQKPRCAMALNWCYNEPWPSAANNNIINWPAKPKPSYAAVKAACRPVLTSARIAKFQWQEGERFTAELWLLNDAPTDQPASEIVAHLEIAGRTIELLRWRSPSALAGQNVSGPSVSIELPSLGASEFTLVLTSTENPTWNSRYRLSVKPDPRAKPVAPGARSRALNT